MAQDFISDDEMVKMESSGKATAPDFIPDEAMPTPTPDTLSPQEGSTAGDLARGAGQGLSFGFSDELMGAARAVKDVLTKDKMEDFLKIYRQRQQEEQAANEAAAQRSPIAYNVGDYGSAILPAIFTGGTSLAGKLGVKGLAKLAAKGAVAGGTQAIGRSKQTIEEAPGELATEAVEGATAGAILAPILGKVFSKGAPKVAGEAEEAIQQSPLKAQLGQAFRAGKAGESFKTSKDVLSREVGKEQGAIKGIKGVFDEAEQKLLSEKKGLLESAKSVLQPEPDKVSQIQPFLDFASKSGEIAKKDLQEVADGLQLYSQGGLSPKAADTLRKKVQGMSAGVQDPNVRGSLSNLADELESGIEKTVPGYGEVNKNIHEFLKSGRETLLSRGKEPEVSRLKVSSLGKEDLKTEQELQRILGTLRDYKGVASKESQGAVDKTIESLKGLSPELQEKLGLNIPGLERQIYSAADQSALANKLLPGTLSDLKVGSGLMGIPSLGEKGLLRGANIAGQVVKKSSDLYKLPKEGLSQAATKLGQSGIPGLTSLGEGLNKALQSGDQHKTNAVLFTILQNPNARRALGYSPEKQNEGEPE